MSLMDQLTERQKIIRVPNAYMLFVQDQKKHMREQYPLQNKSLLRSFMGKKWRSLDWKEKQVYYDKYHDLRKTAKKTKKGAKSAESLIKAYSDDVVLMRDNVSTDNQDSGVFICDNNAPLADEMDDEIVEIEEPNVEPPCAIDSQENSSSQVSKSKSKKICRPPNAYMLFASEQRKLLVKSQGEPPIHANSILGNMWRELPETEKEKYFAEAMRLNGLHQKMYPGYSNYSREAKNKKTKQKGNKNKGKMLITKIFQKKKPKKESSKSSIVLNRVVDKIQTNEQDEQSAPIAETENGTVALPRNAEETPKTAEAAPTADIPQPEYRIPNASSSSAFHSTPVGDGFRSSFCHCRHSCPQWAMDKYNDFYRFHAHDRSLNRPCYGNSVSMPHLNLPDSSVGMYPPGFQHFSHPYHCMGPFMNSYGCCPSPWNPLPSPYHYNSYFPEGYRGSFPNMPLPAYQPATVRSETTISSRNDDYAAAVTEEADDSSSKDSLVIVDEENEDDVNVNTKT